jgi:uncharacterized membrane protein
LIGGMIVGWGAFNVVEGVVDHLILGLHHVREGPDAPLYDLAFLVWGVVMVGVGGAIIRRAGRSR